VLLKLTMDEANLLSHPKFGCISPSKLKTACIRFNRQDSLPVEGKSDRVTTAATAGIDDDRGIDEPSVRLRLLPISEGAATLLVQMRKPGSPPASEHWLRTQLSGNRR